MLCVFSTPVKSGIGGCVRHFCCLIQASLRDAESLNALFQPLKRLAKLKPSLRDEKVSELPDEKVSELRDEKVSELRDEELFERKADHIRSYSQLTGSD